MKPIFLGMLVAIISPALRSAGQGAFQNLDFESAKIVPNNQPSLLAVGIALPGWTMQFGSAQQSQINYDDESLGSTAVTLIGSNDPYGVNCIEGNFGVILQGGVTALDASISQTGLVPAGTMSIQFKAVLDPSQGPVLLSLGGENITFYAIATGPVLNSPNYTLYGANISALAGTVQELKFTVPSALQGFGADNGLNLDSIVFSPNPVPEPATWSLLLCSASLLAINRRKHPSGLHRFSLTPASAQRNSHQSQKLSRAQRSKPVHHQPPQNSHPIPPSKSRQGRPTLAQPFMAGSKFLTNQVPQGRKKFPSGTTAHPLAQRFSLTPNFSWGKNVARAYKKRF